MTTNEAPASPYAPPADFSGKVALVVGASRGIGAATARLFASRGARVVLAARDQEALAALATVIGENGGEAMVVPTDLADPASIRSLGEFIDRKVGRLDCAFNNAGEGYRPTPLAEVPPEAFERVQRITVIGTFLVMREEIRIILGGGGGAIVNMSSTAGVSAFLGGGPYIAAKHAILGLTKAAAIDYASRGLRVNAVAPGPIATDRIQGLSEEQRQRIREAVPMRSIGTPEDVAEAVLWLSGSAAPFVTGTTLFVDGGRMAGTA